MLTVPAWGDPWKFWLRFGLSYLLIIVAPILFGWWVGRSQERYRVEMQAEEELRRWLTSVRVLREDLRPAYELCRGPRAPFPNVFPALTLLLPADSADLVRAKADFELLAEARDRVLATSELASYAPFLYRYARAVADPIKELDSLQFPRSSIAIVEDARRALAQASGRPYLERGLPGEVLRFRWPVEQACLILPGLVAQLDTLAYGDPSQVRERMRRPPELR